MNRTIEIIDPEGERRLSRQKKILTFAILFSLLVLGYPEVRDYSTKWAALKASTKVSLYLSALKTQAVLKRSPLEAQFKIPETIEVFEVSSCGPHATLTKVWEVRLSSFSESVEFVSETWVHDHMSSRETMFKRFCYDPLYGSSVAADGLAEGAVFLAHQLDIQSGRSDQVVQLVISGSAGDIGVE